MGNISATQLVRAYRCSCHSSERADPWVHSGSQILPLGGAAPAGASGTVTGALRTQADDREEGRGARTEDVHTPGREEQPSRSHGPRPEPSHVEGGGGRACRHALREHAVGLGSSPRPAPPYLCSSARAAPWVGLSCSPRRCSVPS